MAVVIFFRIAIFQRETSIGQAILENRQFFRAVTLSEQLRFGGGACSEYKYLQKSFFFEAGTSAQHQLLQKRYFFNKGTSSKVVLFQNSYFVEKANFSEKQYSALPAISEESLFQSGY